MNDQDRTLGGELQRWREATETSQRQAAAAAGINRVTYRKIEADTDPEGVSIGQILALSTASRMAVATIVRLLADTIERRRRAAAVDAFKRPDRPPGSPESRATAQPAPPGPTEPRRRPGQLRETEAGRKRWARTQAERQRKRAIARGADPDDGGAAGEAADAD